MSPVTFETVSTNSSYADEFFQPHLVAEASHSIYWASTSRSGYVKMVFDYQERGLRVATGSSRAPVQTEDELRASFAALGFDYDPSYDFSNTTAAAIARAATTVPENTSVDAELPPA